MKKNLCIYVEIGEELINAGYIWHLSQMLNTGKTLKICRNNITYRNHNNT